MPQPAINIAKICFVTNYGKSRNYNFLNNNILYHLLGGIYGPQKDEHQDARISPQATTPVTIKYGYTFYDCYHVKCLIHDVCIVHWLV